MLHESQAVSRINQKVYVEREVITRMERMYRTMAAVEMICVFFNFIEILK